MSSAFPRMQDVVTCCALLSATALYAQNPAVLTAEYDNNRTTANNSETVLSPLTVTPATFGRIGSWTLDGQVVGQPLYVPGVGNGSKSTNVLYVATMNNTVYALNADAPSSAPLWQVNLGPAVPLNYAGTCPAYFSARSSLGILSTPVIDSNGKTMYVVAANPVPNQATYTHTLYALDLATGAQKHGGSVVISGSVPGIGSTSVNGSLNLGPTTTNLIQRPALLLANGIVSVAFSGCGPDPSPYHGWVVGYNSANLKQAFVHSDTPNGDEGGIWQAGRGLVGDAAGSIYYEAGNGTADFGPDFGESFVKLSTTGQVQSWFTPNNVQTLSDLDLDLSTTSPLLTPDTNLLIGGGKQGVIYVLNPASLGGGGAPVQTFLDGPGCDALSNFNDGCRVHSLAYWQNAGPSQLYVWGVNQTLQDFSFANGQFSNAPTAQSAQTAGYPGGILTVTSAAGVPATGIVWALTPDGLHAFSAANVGDELWNSNENAGRDALAGSYHFEQYTVVAGKVFVPDAQNRVVVYGLLPH